MFPSHLSSCEEDIYEVIKMTFKDLCTSCGYLEFDKISFADKDKFVLFVIKNHVLYRLVVVALLCRSSCRLASILVVKLIGTIQIES